MLTFPFYRQTGPQIRLVIRLSGRPDSLVELLRHTETVRKSFLLGCFSKSLITVHSKTRTHTTHKHTLKPSSLTSLACNNLVRNKLTAHLALQVLGLKAFLEPSQPQTKGTVSTRLGKDTLSQSWHIPKWGTLSFSTRLAGPAPGEYIFTSGLQDYPLKIY